MLWRTHWTGSNLFLTPLALGYLHSPRAFLCPLGQKALRDLSKEPEPAWRATASHSPTSLQALTYFYSKENFHDLTNNRKYTSAGGCCSPALATLVTLLLAPE